MTDEQIIAPVAEELMWHLREYTLPAALALLPGRMDSPAARAMLLAIGLQESRFEHRVQVPNGPAHGFWQFEKGGGVKGVIDHPVTAPIIGPICDLLGYHALTPICYEAIEHNDVLAAIFARLLLWVDPRVLPTEHDALKGWQMYQAQWRPGKPHPETWTRCFAEGWRVVKGA